MHNESLPPSDRDEQQAAPAAPHQKPDPALIERVLALRARWQSYAKLSKKLGYSPAVVTLYLGGKYVGDIDRVESRLRDYVDSEERRRHAGVPTVECPAADELRAALELARRTNDISCIVGEPGEGKTRAIELYVMGDGETSGNPTSVLVEVTSWRKDLGSIEGALFEAVGKAGWDGRTKRAEWLVKKLRGSDRLILVDDAHKLTQPALQWLFDFHDHTGCPMALVGTYALETKLRSDPQRFSRVGFWKELTPKDSTKLIDHLIETLCGGASDQEQAELVGLCRQVAENHGHYRSVFKQLKLAGEVKSGKASMPWPACFRAAHTRLVRDYKLN